jgi:hypothetical protein
VAVSQSGDDLDALVRTAAFKFLSELCAPHGPQARAV